MKKLLAASLVLSASLLAPALSRATTWNIDPAHTSSAFSVKHMMISNVKGQFGSTTGTVELDDKDLTKSSVNVSIDSATIDTGNKDRDTDVKSDKFFDVAKYPAITFKSTKIAKKGKDHYTVTGDLTMHGVTKPVVLDVDNLSGEQKDPWGNIRRAVHATGKVNRQDYGVSWNAKLDGGGVVVGDEVSLDINAEMTKAAPAPAASPAASPAK